MNVAALLQDSPSDNDIARRRGQQPQSSQSQQSQPNNAATNNVNPYPAGPGAGQGPAQPSTNTSSPSLPGSSSATQPLGGPGTPADPRSPHPASSHSSPAMASLIPSSSTLSSTAKGPPVITSPRTQSSISTSSPNIVGPGVPGSTGSPSILPLSNAPSTVGGGGSAVPGPPRMSIGPMGADRENFMMTSTAASSGSGGTGARQVADWERRKDSDILQLSSNSPRQQHPRDRDPRDPRDSRNTSPILTRLPGPGIGGLMDVDPRDRERELRPDPPRSEILQLSRDIRDREPRERDFAPPPPPHSHHSHSLPPPHSHHSHSHSRTLSSRSVERNATQGGGLTSPPSSASTPSARHSLPPPQSQVGPGAPGSGAPTPGTKTPLLDMNRDRAPILGVPGPVTAVGSNDREREYERIERERWIEREHREARERDREREREYPLQLRHREPERPSHSHPGSLSSSPKIERNDPRGPGLGPLPGAPSGLGERRRSAGDRERDRERIWSSSGSPATDRNYPPPPPPSQQQQQQQQLSTFPPQSQAPPSQSSRERGREPPTTTTPPDPTSANAPPPPPPQRSFQGQFHTGFITGHPTSNASAPGNATTSKGPSRVGTPSEGRARGKRDDVRDYERGGTRVGYANHMLDREVLSLRDVGREREAREAREREARERERDMLSRERIDEMMAGRERLMREREETVRDMHYNQAREQEWEKRERELRAIRERERDVREREMRERDAREMALKEMREREGREREYRDKEREREREYREREREYKEREKEEREYLEMKREREFREREGAYGGYPPPPAPLPHGHPHGHLHIRHAHPSHVHGHAPPPPPPHGHVHPLHGHPGPPPPMHPGGPPMMEPSMMVDAPYGGGPIGPGVAPTNGPPGSVSGAFEKYPPSRPSSRNGRRDGRREWADERERDMHAQAQAQAQAQQMSGQGAPMQMQMQQGWMGELEDEKRPIAKKVVNLGRFVWPNVPFPWFFDQVHGESQVVEGKEKSKEGEKEKTEGEKMEVDDEECHKDGKEEDEFDVDSETRMTVVIPNAYIPLEKPRRPRIWGGGVFAKLRTPHPGHPSFNNGSPAKSPTTPYRPPYRRIYTDDSDVFLCALHSGWVTWNGAAKARKEGKEMKVEVRVLKCFGGGRDGWVGGGDKGIKAETNGKEKETTVTGPKEEVVARFLGGWGEKCFIDITEDEEDDGRGLVSAGWGIGHDGSAIEVLDVEFVQRGSICSLGGIKNRKQRLKEYNQRRTEIIGEATIPATWSSARLQARKRRRGYDWPSTYFSTNDDEEDPSIKHVLQPEEEKENQEMEIRTIVFGSNGLGYKYDPQILQSVLFPSDAMPSRKKRRILESSDTSNIDPDTMDIDSEEPSTPAKNLRPIILETGKESYLLAPSKSSNEDEDEEAKYDLSLVLEGQAPEPEPVAPTAPVEETKQKEEPPAPAPAEPPAPVEPPKPAQPIEEKEDGEVDEDEPVPAPTAPAAPAPEAPTEAPKPEEEKSKDGSAPIEPEKPETAEKVNFPPPAPATTNIIAGPSTNGDVPATASTAPAEEQPTAAALAADASSTEPAPAPPKMNLQTLHTDLPLSMLRFEKEGVYVKDGELTVGVRRWRWF